jgi:hypothetical protein
MIYADPDSQFVLIDNTSSVQLILTLLMITYGLNRIFIFWHMSHMLLLEIREHHATFTIYCIVLHITHDLLP